MKFPIVNLILALVYMSLSVWMFQSSVNPSIVHLLPLLAGIILLALNNGIKEGAKEQTRFAGYVSGFLTMVMGYLLLTDNVFKEEEFTLCLGVFFVSSLITFVVFIRDNALKPKAR
jgi:hypothetical protein